MRHGSLCSGLGGFDYAAQMMGWENVFSCEKEPFCRTILNYYWPKAKHYADVFEFNGNDWRGRVDIITAGFPCQPFSVAGKRGGDKDDRFIWTEIKRIVGDAKPGWLVLENVTGLASILQSANLTNLESEAYKFLQKAEVARFGKRAKRDKMAYAVETVEKRVIAQIIEDLNVIGYDTPRLADGTPIILCIPACATGAPHRRDRLWIVAFAGNKRCNDWSNLREERHLQTNQRIATENKSKRKGRECGVGSFDSDVSNAESRGLSKSGAAWDGSNGLADNVSNDSNTINGRSKKQEQQAAGDKQYSRENWLEAATRLCTLDDGTTDRLDVETISKSKWRTESLKGAGNAIVWEVAYQIFNALENANQ